MDTVAPNKAMMSSPGAGEHREAHQAIFRQTGPDTEEDQEPGGTVNQVQTVNLLLLVSLS